MPLGSMGSIFMIADATVNQIGVMWRFNDERLEAKEQQVIFYKMFFFQPMSVGIDQLCGAIGKKLFYRSASKGLFNKCIDFDVG